jgi:hypothetical protein
MSFREMYFSYYAAFLNLSWPCLSWKSGSNPEPAEWRQIYFRHHVCVVLLSYWGLDRFFPARRPRRLANCGSDTDAQDCKKNTTIGLVTHGWVFV